MTPALTFSLICLGVGLTVALTLTALRPGPANRSGSGSDNEAGKGNGIYYVLGTDRDVSPPRVILMTSQAFSTLHEADTYASGCAGAWGAFVVKAVDTSHLRTLSVPH